MTAGTEARKQLFGMEGNVEQLIARLRGLSCASFMKPTLVYFDIIGIAWNIRCLLHMKGVDYDLIEVDINLDLPTQRWA